MMAAKEDKVNVVIIAVAKAAKVELDLKGNINVKKLWRLCRRILDTPQLSSQLAIMPRKTDGLPKTLNSNLRKSGGSALPFCFQIHG
jgi:hypothetical protein